MDLRFGLVIALGLCVLHANDVSAEEITLVGASSFVLNYNGLFVYTSDSYYLINMDNPAVSVGKYSISNLGLPADLDLSAVVATYESQWKRNFYGASYGYLKSWAADREERSFKYKRELSLFRQNDGPDAAVRRNSAMYLFQGCKFITIYSMNEWSKVEDMTAYGLPCNLNAAWKHTDSKSALLRGDEVWFWDEIDNSVTGPTKFTTLFPSFTMDTLIPYTE